MQPQCRALRSSLGQATKQLAATRAAAARAPLGRFAPARIDAVGQLPVQLQSHPHRSLHTTRRLGIGLTEGADSTTRKSSEPHDKPAGPTPVTDEEFHELANGFFETLLERLETMQETRGDMDVEYSAGVLTVLAPPAGTYVLNKQPPNKQIWLSSPLTGPKRYDWCSPGDGLGDKQESAPSGGEWIYLRDGSSLSSVLRKELGIDLASTEL